MILTIYVTIPFKPYLKYSLLLDTEGSVEWMQ